MTLSDVGREGVRLVSQLTGVAISVPVVAGFVLLGATVLVGRSQRSREHESRSKLRRRRGRPSFPAAGYYGDDEG